jgi:hypothetical protein
LSKKHGVHPNMISGWKRAAIANMASGFGKDDGGTAKDTRMPAKPFALACAFWSEKRTESEPCAIKSPPDWRRPETAILLKGAEKTQSGGSLTSREGKSDVQTLAIAPPG